jgi:hypothetical protein
MEHEAEDTETRRAAANATLCALYSLLPNPRAIRGESVLILPAMRPLSRTAAVEYLASLPKPLSCIAVEVRGLMALGVWETGSDGDEWPEFATMLRAVFEECVAHGDSKALQAEVLVLGGDHQKLPLTFAQCEHWLSTYEFPLADINIAPLHRHDRTAEACCVVRMVPSAGGTLNTSAGE